MVSSSCPTLNVMLEASIAPFFGTGEQIALMDVITSALDAVATAPRHLICSYSLVEPSHGEYSTRPEAGRRYTGMPWTMSEFV